MRPLFTLLIVVFIQVANAQNPQLTASPWYLTNLALNGTNYTPPINTEVPFVQLTMDATGVLQTAVCQGSLITGAVSYVGNNSFLINSAGQLSGGCWSHNGAGESTNQTYDRFYTDFWFPRAGTATFNYSIHTINNALQLVITNSNGDVATYGPTIPTASTGDVLASSFRLYPNPTTSVLYLAIDNGQQLETVTIFDIAGRSIMSQKMNTNTLNLSSLNSGVYIFQVAFTNGSVSMQRFIKE